MKSTIPNVATKGMGKKMKGSSVLGMGPMKAGKKISFGSAGKGSTKPNMLKGGSAGKGSSTPNIAKYHATRGRKGL